MRPLKLTMSAFGSYAGEVCIDFSSMDQGIFLVTGDTGSGKTTIFDGIVYALYDRTSGGVRDGNMMRSAYADLRTPTFVELTFSCRGESWRIVRNPDYERESLRKDKNGNPRKTQEKSKVELYLKDGSLYRGNKKETNQKIEELLGMDARQFMQMAMIAQGDFLKLLHARSEERKEIFSRIFDTHIYGRIQEKLRQQEKECYGQLKDQESAISEQMGRILAPPQWQKEEQWKDAKESLDVETAVSLLKELLEEGKEREEQLRKEREEIQIQIQENQKQKEVLEALTQIQEKRKNQRLWMEEQLPKEAEYKSRTETARKQLEQIEEELQKAQQKLEKDLEQALSHQDVLQTRLEDMESLKRIWQEAILCLKRQKEQAAVWEQANTDYQNARAEYETMYEAFFQEQAGVLAGTLKPGKPCPVCGSTHHPQKAVLSPGAPNQNQVRRAKEQAKRAEERREQAQTVYQKEAQAYQSALGSLNQEGKRLLGNGFDPASPQWREQASKAMEQAKAAMETLKKEVFRIRQDGEKGVLQRKQEQREKKSQLEQCQSLWENFLRKSEQIRGEWKASGEEEKRLLENWEQLSKGRNMQRDQLKAMGEALDATYKELDGQHRERYSQNQANAQTLTVLETYRKAYGEKQEAFALLRHLSQTAGGSLPGSAKLDFESYIQRQYFEEIIQRANKRLLQMSQGQFLLKCKEINRLNNRGKAGLDLDIYSLVTESARDVKTLSGGESFMAALSMALGLADVVQDRAGAIRLDTMFIDEGFGSLDDSAREQAIRVLYELAGENRLIGIISHVTELKEQIEKQLVVKKGKRGSHISWS